MKEPGVFSIEKNTMHIQAVNSVEIVIFAALAKGMTCRGNRI